MKVKQASIIFNYNIITGVNMPVIKLDLTKSEYE